MIKNIIDLLASSEWLVNDFDIQFAKGAYALPKDMETAIKQIKRNKKWIKEQS